MTLTETRTRYQIANDLTTIFQAMQMCGMDVPDFDYGTVKVHCPFDDEQAFRVYGADNAAYCFACSKRYSPVSLIAEYRGIDIDEAADFLIEKAEQESRYIPPTPDARWEALMSEPFPLDRPAEADALKLFCARIDPEWSRRQFEPRIASLLTRCLAPLDKVTTAEDLQLWRSTTRSAMQRALSTEGENRG